MHISRNQIIIITLGCVSALLVFFCGLKIQRRVPAPPVLDDSIEVSIFIPIRPQPERFPPNTHLPNLREGLVSGSIDLKTFSSSRDLMHIHDQRVWWESEHDKTDTEDDHIIHKSVEIPMRRLIELVSQAGGQLKVQDAYRPTGIHNPTSLHKEGRAIDITCEELSMEQLAKICWAAGFDWVYHEAGSKNGAHVHCSVKR